jgi:hypothetical protein
MTVSASPRTSRAGTGYLGFVASPSVWVRVRFTEPVEGPDPYASHRTTDDRHEFKCRWLRHRGTETLFGTEDEIIEHWPTERIQMVEWRVDEVATSQGIHKGSSLADRRLASRASRLGAPWTDGEEAQLREEHTSGMSLDEMAGVHERNVGGIRSRLMRLGLDGSDQASPGEQ